MSTSLASCPSLPLPELLKDGRLTDLKREGLSGWGVAAWGLFRWAALQVTRTRTRAWLADQLKISEKTLDDWVSPGGASVPRSTSLFEVLGLLSVGDQAVAGRYLAWAMGCECVGAAAADADAAPVAVQALEVCAALGRVHALILAASGAGSEGGIVVTAEEAAGILPLAEQLHLEAAEIVGTLRKVVRG